MIIDIKLQTLLEDRKEAHVKELNVHALILQEKGHTSETINNTGAYYLHLGAIQELNLILKPFN